jgi:hypothetical protein
LRVRVIAPERVRAARIEQQHGLTPEAAVDYVREADRDLAARVRFLYHLDWEEPLVYDIVLNTERLGVARAVAVLCERLQDERLTPTEVSRRALRERSLVALARAALLANPITRPRTIGVTVASGSVELTGRVETEAERQAAEAAVARITGVSGVRNGLVVLTATHDVVAHGQFRHGEERSWGGYGGGGYEHERRQREQRERDRDPRP